MSTTAKITIEIGSNGVASVEFLGNERLIIPLIGTLEHTKADLIIRARDKFGFGLKWEETERVVPVRAKEDLSTEKYDIYPPDQMLPRDRAIEATQYAIEALNLRIDAMKKSPPSQSFAVDHDLLSQI